LLQIKNKQFVTSDIVSISFANFSQMGSWRQKTCKEQETV